MDKGIKFDFGTDWAEMWMKQNQAFFDTAERMLKDFFNTNAFMKPEEHMRQIQQWQEAFRNQWQMPNFGDQQRIYEQYWTTMVKLYSDSLERMMDMWMVRSKNNDPIASVQELYQVWLKSCQEVFGKTIASTNYQDMYGDWMNNVLKFWKTMTPK